MITLTLTPTTMTLVMTGIALTGYFFGTVGACTYRYFRSR